MQRNRLLQQIVSPAEGQSILFNTQGYECLNICLTVCHEIKVKKARPGHLVKQANLCATSFT